MHDLYNIIPDIYDCIGNPPEKVSDLLDKFSDQNSLAGANIISTHQFEDAFNSIYASGSISKHLPEYFDRGFSSLDNPMLEYLLRTRAAGDFEFDSDIFKEMDNVDHEGLNSIHDLNAWMFNKLNIISRGSLIIDQNPGCWNILTVYLSRSEVEYKQEIKKKVQFITKHLSKVLEFKRPFELLSAKFNAILSVLNSLHLGVIVFDQKRNMLAKNLAAQRILDEKDGLTCSNKGRIEIDSMKLELLMGSLLNQNDQLRTSTFLVSRMKSKSPLIIKLSLTNFSELDVNRYFVLIVIDPEFSKIVDTTGLKLVFNLSDSEAKVCGALVDGLSQIEIAEARNVSPETVKTQIKAIYNKLGCRNKVEIVNLAHSISIPIDE